MLGSFIIHLTMNYSEVFKNGTRLAIVSMEHPYEYRIFSYIYPN